jgi:D-amino peptidase
MKTITVALLPIISCFTYLLYPAAPAAERPRVLIVTDMEGVGGVQDADEQLVPGQRRFEESRKLLIAEVTAAVQGALAGGAKEIVIWDGHDGSRTLSVSDIHPAAQLIQGKPTPADFYMEDRLYDGILFIGQHAMAGAKNAILSHTQSFSVQSITINGQPVGELGQVAAIAGHFNIPVIMLSGDQAACDEMVALQPKAETVAVKRLVGKRSALSLSHEKVCQMIQSAAARAVKRLPEFSPWKISSDVEMRIEFYPEAAGVPAAALATEQKQYTAKAVVYRGRTVLEAFQQWLGK